MFSKKVISTTISPWDRGEDERAYVPTTGMLVLTNDDEIAQAHLAVYPYFG